MLCLTFVPGDRHVLAGLKSGALLIIDIATGDVLEEIQAHDKELWSVCLQPDQVHYNQSIVQLLLFFFNLEGLCNWWRRCNRQILAI